jgi:hypothetical protein
MKKQKSDLGVNVGVGAILVIGIVLIVALMLAIPAWIMQHILAAFNVHVSFWICLAIWWLLGILFGYAGGSRKGGAA